MQILKKVKDITIVIACISLFLYVALWLFNKDLSDFFGVQGLVFSIVGLISLKVVEYATN